MLLQTGWLALGLPFGPGAQLYLPGKLIRRAALRKI